MIYKRLVETHAEVRAIFSFHKFKGRGQQLIPVVPIADVGLILKAVVPGLRMPMTKKRALLGLYEPLRKFTEIEIHDRITRALRQFTCVPQYRVGKYRLDLYFPQEKLAVECDERGHVGYKQSKEEERYELITSQLGCTWVRYDPYNPKFDIFDLTNQILHILMLSYTLKT